MKTIPLGLVLDALYALSAPAVLLYIAFVSRGFTRPKYRRGLLSKLGRVPSREGDSPAFWIHAVSVGEVLTAVPLVRVLERRFPDWDISISVSTYTGFEVASKQFPERCVFYFPLDASVLVSQVLRKRRPTAVVLMELEIWPNFLLTARRRRVPVFVANGRMTERSSRRYARLGGLARFFFRRLTACAVQNDAYAARFRLVGVPPERIAVLGNLKHDRRAAVPGGEGDALRQRLGWPRGKAVVLVAGCTHPSEEALVCSLVREIRASEPNLRLILAPRHVERLVPGETERWGSDRPVVRWSHLAPGGEVSSELRERTLVVDTVGELERFYAAADVVVVGGSFIPHGGHNLLEPARLGKPVLFGPHYQNFAEEAAHLLSAEAAVCCRDGAELRHRLLEVVSDSALAKTLGERAQRVTNGLEGAAERHATWLAEKLGAAG